MRKILTIIAFISFFSSFVFAQTWNTLVPYETDDHLSAVTKMIKTTDDALLVLIRKATDEGFTKISHYLLKYNLEGELLWEKEYDFGVVDPVESPLWGGGIPKDIIQLDNGNFFMTGTYGDVDSIYPYVFLVDENGDSLAFQQTIEIQELNYVNSTVLGFTVDLVSNKMFIELNEFGDVITQVSFDDVEITKMIINEANQEIFTSFPVVPQKIKKFNFNGNNLDQLILPSDYRINVITLNELGGITGYSDDVIKFDDNLNEMWNISFEEIFPGENLFDYNGTGIIKTTDEGYVILGSYCEEFFPCLVYIIKLDKDGNREWGGLYSPNNLPLEHIQNIIEVDDGYILIGTNSFTEKIWLVKLNEEGIFTSIDNKVDSSFNGELYPNPVHHNLSVKFSKTFSGNIQIIDIMGRQFFNEKVFSIDVFNANVASYSPGYYYIQLINTNSQLIYAIPMIKQ